MNKKFQILALLFATTFIASSCKKQIDEAYANPNAAVKVPVEALLPQMVSALAGNYAGHGMLNDNRYIGMYVQNFGFSGAGEVYDIMAAPQSDNAASWYRVHYYDLGQNLNRMIDWATEEKKWDYVGVGHALFAFSWLTLTDVHGEVTLKEAFNTSQLTFKYDTQEEVYEHVRKTCFTALSFLNRTGDGVSQANLAKGDEFFFNGDVNKWKKFVYSVLARYHLHLSNKPAFKADSVIHYANLSIQNNADNALVKFANSGVTATANFFGPLRNNIGARAIRQGAYIANMMNGTNSLFAGVEDPRAWYMLRGNANNTIVGVPQGLGQVTGITVANNRPENFWGVPQTTAVNNVPPTTDENCRYIFRNASSIPIITASEIQFMKAEAAFKKGDKATALAAYKLGIEQHFDMLTTTYNVNIPAARVITPAMRNAYINNTRIVPASANDLTLSHIMLQKYIALYAYGCFETWVDMRRYNYTDVDGGLQVYRDFVLPTGTRLFVDNAGLPVQRIRPRFNSEYVWNIEELRRIGADAVNYHTKKMWFAQP
jgi:Starch-binding associating with outer membrane